MEINELKERGISRETAKVYGVQSEQEAGKTLSHYYPYFDDEKKPVGFKVRNVATKDFFWKGEATRASLFGQQIWEPGSHKKITLVEGECDAMAAFQMQGSRYPVVSVHSAGQAPKNVADNFEYLNSFEEIIVCFDKDEAKIRPDGTQFFPGQEAARVVAGMFPIGKVRVLTLREGKDPNDYLLAGKAAEFTKEW